ncbi:hypothetical protein [Deinococcus ruber]|uniref:Uncharacterized protein n=1 Tax=Deinococcus ruber TaxID=1848197 RepID=A0A918FFB8_9DEIO|nr:hypothetical protein [Deinococcus ruber]GGR34590.1 hypothetical protein GCM10008957_50860 [Deinococcus ruber]
MSVLDSLYSDLSPTTEYYRNGVDPGNEITREVLEALNDFSIVPADFMALFILFGNIAFTSKTYGFTFSLRSPIESHEFYFGDERSDILPDMFPMTTGVSPSTLWYGDIDQTRGVYIAHDSSSWPSMMKYVAPSLFKILFEGIGLEIVSKY